MKKVFLSLLIVFTLSAGSFAGTPDEGMWLPIFVERLNFVDMQKMGLNLTAEEIYSINNSSMKDAIVNFGNFCTAEVVSPDGLLLTNHHCGYDAIQTHSSIEHDYLTDGFWAMSRDEELQNDGLTATFFVRMEDVTERVLEGVTGEMTETERSEIIEEEILIIEGDAEEDGKYNVEVQSFFEGNEYYLFVYETFEDIRLVGAPPSAIGKYGGDTDNWMWPRHTGDFSMFRVYTAPDGSPASYDEENVPMKSKYHLPISLKGVEREDFAMIWGYPGGTDRYRTSYGIQLTIEQQDPAVIDIGNVMLPIMKEGMDKSEKMRIDYATTYAQIANMWKNKIGELRGLKRLKVYEKKQILEGEFQIWVDADEERQAKYGEVLKDFEQGYSELLEMKIQSTMWYYQAPFFLSKLMTFPLQNRGLEGVLSNKKVSQDDLESFKKRAKAHFSEYDSETEMKLYASALKLLYENVPVDLQPDIFGKLILPKFGTDFEAFAEYVFEESIFTTDENFNAFIKKPKEKKFLNDPVKQVTDSYFSNFMALNGVTGEITEKLDRAKRLYIEGLREMLPGKVFYPDANFTMRLTYGEVLDYYPADAIHYDYTTTLSGVMEKEDPTNEEFIVPEKLKELYEDKDFGDYGDDDVVVCFLTNNDITGGNSGSPVINGDGELIGIAFDGNWEAMSGDIAFEPELQRTISVDIRYVMFIIDKYAGAQNLLDEMTIHK